jgi:hypothetical protein
MKFVGGAWIAILLIPVLVWFFFQVNVRRRESEADYTNPGIISVS